MPSGHESDSYLNQMWESYDVDSDKDQRVFRTLSIASYKWMGSKMSDFSSKLHGCEEDIARLKELKSNMIWGVKSGWSVGKITCFLFAESIALAGTACMVVWGMVKAYTSYFTEK